MADLSVIKEYLVKLGFEADNAQYARVQQVLDRLSFTVHSFTTDAGGTGSVTGNSGSAPMNSWPPYSNVLYCQKD